MAQRVKTHCAMKINQVAAQLYTLRDQCKTPDDIARSLEKVRAIGYEAVQVSGLGPIPEADLLQLAKDNGLVICATHEGLGALFENPEAIIERLQKLECTYTALGFPSGVDLATKDGVLDFCRRIDAVAQKFVEAGMSLSHHNHHHEFFKVEGKPVFEMILENTTHLGLEIDTYWVQYGGANPTTWCQKAAGRMPLLHLKDYGINSQNQPYFAEIGKGNLEFFSIIETAEAGGTQWFIVEQDTTPGDPFDSLKLSFDYIKDNLII